LSALFGTPRAPEFGEGALRQGAKTTKQETKNMKNEIQQKLEKLADKKSKPFCYHCYKVALSGVCQTCFSDDLMRSMDQVGVEWGYDWVIREILRTGLTPVDLEDAFEESIRECYKTETVIGYITVDTCDAIRTLDPVAWDLGKSEYIDTLEADELIISFNVVMKNNYLNQTFEVVICSTQNHAPSGNIKLKRCSLNL